MSINTSGDVNMNEGLRKAGLRVGCFTIQIAAAAALVLMADTTAGGSTGGGPFKHSVYKAAYGAVACAALAIGLSMVMLMTALKGSAAAV
ncbi:hypothetical protein QJS10_CPB11g01630 [Acorus calamus]|uniref:CASP-like protein n=1 Tax=Acorus calamus TaxID=4465 RepID=A0AAV9DS21_ACOCL|nr:hypothetical protein QJS10_CPB11g01630 [Acorus calamus]